MKKLILAFFILALCACIRSSAQFLIGPQAGMNLATLNGTDISVSSKPLWHAGVFISIPLGKHFSIMPAVLYSMKGYKYNDTTSTNPNLHDSSAVVTENVNASLGYLDVPVLLTFFSEETKGFMIQAGPQFSYLISGNANATSTVSIKGGAAQNTTPATGTSISFNNTDFSLIGGIGYKFQKLLMLYARVATSLSKTQKGGWVTDATTGHNFVFEAGAALCLGAK